jgi:hypothetical protein
MDGQAPKGWKIYEVKGAAQLVTGLSEEPVVAATHGGDYQQCWGQPWTDPSPQPKLEAWECSAAPWFMDRAQLNKVWVASGPSTWKHIDIKQLDSTTETRITPTKVTDVEEGVSSISFHVSEIGKPVLVKTSYFPNWQAHGATGPYRAAPNYMVVVPTSHDVKLTYGLTSVDWLGRFVTLGGVIALGALITWQGFERFGAGSATEADDSSDDTGDDTNPDGDDAQDAPEADTGDARGVPTGLVDAYETGGDPPPEPAGSPAGGGPAPPGQL